MGLRMISVRGAGKKVLGCTTGCRHKSAETGFCTGYLLDKLPILCVVGILSRLTWVLKAAE
jgi:hypothetical protein